MLVKWNALILATILSFNVLSGAVVEAPNLDILEQHMEYLDKDSLVVFDVDHTLLVPTDLLFAPSGEQHLAHLQKKLQERGIDKDRIWSLIALQGKVCLIDPKILNILATLKEKNIKTIALTAIPTGRIGLVPSMEIWRVNQLTSLGIDFGWSFHIDSIVFNEFTGKGCIPVYKQGVLASARHPKGQILCAFLKQIGWRPSRVFFVDDRLDFIDSVEEALSRENIEHTSFHYTAATDSKKKFDQQIADFQFEYLLKNDIWLSDDEAQHKMIEPFHNQQVGI